MSKVDPSICVWCKEEPADGEVLHGINNGESICENCLKDARRFKRDIDFWVITSTRIPEELRTNVSEAAYEAGGEVFEESDWGLESHPAVTSNAKGREREDTD